MTQIFCLDADLLEPFDITSLDKRRWSLKCCYSQCKINGVCMQCSKPKCKAAVHRGCLDFTDMVHQWVEDEETAIYEVFCKHHQREEPDTACDGNESQKPKRGRPKKVCFYHM